MLTRDDGINIRVALESRIADCKTYLVGNTINPEFWKERIRQYERALNEIINVAYTWPEGGSEDDSTDVV